MFYTTNKKSNGESKHVGNLTEIDLEAERQGFAAQKLQGYRSIPNGKGKKCGGHQFRIGL